MKRKAVAVIGAGFGDEGKGLMTDFYVSALKSVNNNPVVIRSNGGAQAGHTVVTPKGQHHVFSHLSSGTFLGATTYLSEFFVVNPILFGREDKELLHNFGYGPAVGIHPHALVTSPFEMLINQSLEHMRGDDPHGSCGVGFGETFERVKRTHLSWRFGYVTGVSKDELYKDFIQLRTEYVPQRVDLTQVSQTFINVINSDQLFDDFFADVEYMKRRVEIKQYADIWDRDVVFEGAQGLLLDQDYGHFPHVTRSNTGMRNVTAIMKQLHPTEFERLEVNYVTRAYTTRHGAGPLPFEKDMPEWVVDDTNVENEWQHKLRYAPLDIDLFNSITSKDFALYGNQHNEYYNVTRTNVVTCVDQIPPLFKSLVSSGKIHHVPKSELINKFDIASYGPTRKDVRVLREA